MSLRARMSALSLCTLTLLLAGCAATGTAPVTTGAIPEAKVLNVPKIHWNRQSLRLRYPSGSPVHAVLTYWGPSGYYPSGPSCTNDGQVQVSTEQQWGDPSGYMNIKYSFEALAAGPSECVFKAILLGVKNPPVATLELSIVH
jgi:hypothetical protein